MKAGAPAITLYVKKTDGSVRYVMICEVHLIENDLRYWESYAGTGVRIPFEDIAEASLYHQGGYEKLMDDISDLMTQQDSREDHDPVYHDPEHVNHMPDNEDRPDWMKSDGMAL